MINHLTKWKSWMISFFIKKTIDCLGADVCIDAVGCEAAGNALRTITGRKLLLQAGLQRLYIGQ